MRMVLDQWLTPLILCLMLNISWVPVSLSAQKLSLEELSKNVQTSTDDSVRVTSLAQISTHFLASNPDTALQIAQDALQQATATELPNVIAAAHVSIGEAYDVLGNLEQSIYHLDEGLGIYLSTNNDKGLARTYNARGLAYYFNGVPDKAIENFEKAIPIVKRLENFDQLASIKSNLGNSYSLVSKYYDALNALLDARNLKDSLSNVEGAETTASGKANTYINLGAFYQGIKQFKLAKESYLAVLDLLPPDQARGRAIIMYNLGTIAQEQENYGRADSLFSESLQQFIDLGANRYIPKAYIALGDIYLQQEQTERADSYFEQADLALGNKANPLDKVTLLLGQSELQLKKNQLMEALRLAEQALAIAEVGNYPRSIADASDLLAQAAEQMENWPLASRYLRDYVNWRDSLDSEDRELELVGLQAVKDVALAEATFERDQAIREADIIRKRNQYLLIALIVISLLAIALGYARRNLAIANQDLNEANDDLADSNLQLETSKQKVTMANTKLQQMAFATGHDLRESLRSITSFTQLAEIELLEDPKQARSSLREAAAGGKRMFKMLDNLLHYSNVGGDEQVMSAFQLKEVIESVKNQLQEDIVNTQGDVLLKSTVKLKADRIGIEQVFFNLVHNAIKYRREGIAPRVSITTEERGEQVVFKVIDNGQGVAADKQTEIFKPFSRLHNRHKSGSGLGLAICQRVVESYGGQIWYEARTEEGSVFCFTLPKAQPQLVDQPIMR